MEINTCTPLLTFGHMEYIRHLQLAFIEVFWPFQLGLQPSWGVLPVVVVSVGDVKEESFIVTRCGIELHFTGCNVNKTDTHEPHVVLMCISCGEMIVDVD